MAGEGPVAEIGNAPCAEGSIVTISQNNGELERRNDLMRTIEIGFRMAGIALQSTQWTQWTREKGHDGLPPVVRSGTTTRVLTVESVNRKKKAAYESTPYVPREPGAVPESNPRNRFPGLRWMVRWNHADGPMFWSSKSPSGATFGDEPKDLVGWRGLHRKALTHQFPDPRSPQSYLRIFWEMRSQVPESTF